MPKENQLTLTPLIGWLLFCFFCLLPLVSNAAALPEKFIGNWVIEISSQSELDGYPWWHNIKYPVNLSIVDKKNGSITSQMGDQCNVDYFYYDKSLDIIVLKYCAGETKSKYAIDPMYLISVKGGKLYGEVRTYKYLFTWIGEKAQP